MGTLSFPGLALTHIVTENICDSDFGSMDPSTRSIASFGGLGSFVTTKRQEVQSSRAIILPSTSIIGVNFDGKVTLVLQDDKSTEDHRELHIVDEGGFCTHSEAITVRTSSGELKITDPYSSMRLRVSHGKCIPEVVVPIVKEDGTLFKQNADGSCTEVDLDGNSRTCIKNQQDETTKIREILVDGTTIITVSRPESTTRRTVVHPDGTIIDTETSADGVISSFTSNVDGSTVDEQVRDQILMSFTTRADGTTIMKVTSSPPSGTTTETKVFSDGRLYLKQTGPRGAILLTSTVKAPKLTSGTRKPSSKYPSIGTLVNQIQSGSSEDQVVKKLCKNGLTAFGLSEKWVRSVFEVRVVGDEAVSRSRIKWGRRRPA
jgi:hypothetical protein